GGALSSFEGVRILAFSRDGARLVSGTETDHDAIEWEIGTGEELFHDTTLHVPTALAVARDGTILAGTTKGHVTAPRRPRKLRKLAHPDETPVLALALS